MLRKQRVIFFANFRVLRWKVVGKDQRLLVLHTLCDGRICQTGKAFRVVDKDVIGAKLPIEHCPVVRLGLPAVKFKEVAKHDQTCAARFRKTALHRPNALLGNVPVLSIAGVASYFRQCTPCRTIGSDFDQPVTKERRRYAVDFVIVLDLREKRRVLQLAPAFVYDDTFSSRFHIACTLLHVEGFEMS